MNDFRILLSALFLLAFSVVCGFDETFVLKDGSTDEILVEYGAQTRERVSPCSTFKIVLSLIGFDAGILLNEQAPAWEYQEGYDDYLESWKTAQNPQSWMKNSCVWFSKILATELSLNTMQNYLVLFDYGNQDMTGGLTTAWLSCSLKISPMEQVKFIQKITQGKLPVSATAMRMTKAMMHQEKLSNGWILFGKTGLGTEGDQQVGWFVGWVEKENCCFPFAYSIRDTKINPTLRIPRFKQLLMEANIL